MRYYVCMFDTRGTAGTFAKSKFTKEIQHAIFHVAIGHVCIYLAGSDFKLYSD